MAQVTTIIGNDKKKQDMTRKFSLKKTRNIGIMAHLNDEKTTTNEVIL